MYNRYIPEDENFLPVGEGPETPAPPERSEEEGGSCPGASQGHQPQSFGPGGLHLPPLFGGRDGGLSALLSRERGGLSGLLKGLGLEGIDSGDVLLLLIILYLLVEGDDLELVIALGLVLLMGFGEKHEA